MQAGAGSGQPVLFGWKPGTVAVLCANGPHAMPVSTAVRASDRLVMLALARRRETLARLREDPRACLCMLAEGIAFSAYGQCHVSRENMRASGQVAALALTVERVTDHLAERRTQLLGGVSWRFYDARARATEDAIVSELTELAHELAGA